MTYLNCLAAVDYLLESYKGVFDSIAPLYLSQRIIQFAEAFRQRYMSTKLCSTFMLGGGIIPLLKQ